MSNLSTSATHLVSISHDPLEENTSAGLDQEFFSQRGQRGFGGSPIAGRRDVMPRSHDSGHMPQDWRPVLLAGAIGLFAAWVVSGMGPRRDRHGAGARSWSERPNQVRGPARAPQAYREAGPEGRSSAHDFELDAMNP